jgi:hypothetical protein
MCKGTSHLILNSSILVAELPQCPKLSCLATSPSPIPICFRPLMFCVFHSYHPVIAPNLWYDDRHGVSMRLIRPDQLSVFIYLPSTASIPFETYLRWLLSIRDTSRCVVVVRKWNSPSFAPPFINVCLFLLWFDLYCLLQQYLHFFLLNAIKNQEKTRPPFRLLDALNIRSPMIGNSRGLRFLGVY